MDSVVLQTYYTQHLLPVRCDNPRQPAKPSVFIRAIRVFIALFALWPAEHWPALTSHFSQTQQMLHFFGNKRFLSFQMCFSSSYWKTNFMLFTSKYVIIKLFFYLVDFTFFTSQRTEKSGCTTLHYWNVLFQISITANVAGRHRPQYKDSLHVSVLALRCDRLFYYSSVQHHGNFRDSISGSFLKCDWSQNMWEWLVFVCPKSL